MQRIADLPLKDAKPSDRAHLLIWDTPNEMELRELRLYNQAYRVSYRTDLLNRIGETSSSFLMLDRRIEREIKAIRDLCATAPKNKLIVLLEDLDCLITYLSIQSDGIRDQFWRKLIDLNHLERRLWIVIPSKIVPHNWPRDRLAVAPAPSYPACNTSIPNS